MPKTAHYNNTKTEGIELLLFWLVWPPANQLKRHIQVTNKFKKKYIYSLYQNSLSYTSDAADTKDISDTTDISDTKDTQDTSDTKDSPSVNKLAPSVRDTLWATYGQMGLSKAH